MTPRPRYYSSRDRASGKYRIIDRDLHSGMVIAQADFREAALLIVLALNHSEKAKPNVNSNPTIPARSSSSPRPAVLGDFISGLQFSYSHSGLRLVEPSPRR